MAYLNEPVNEDVSDFGGERGVATEEVWGGDIGVLAHHHEAPVVCLEAVHGGAGSVGVRHGNVQDRIGRVDRNGSRTS